MGFGLGNQASCCRVYDVKGLVYIRGVRTLSSALVPRCSTTARGSNQVHSHHKLDDRHAADLCLCHVLPAAESVWTPTKP